LDDDASIADALTDTFGLILSPEDIRSTVGMISRFGRRGAAHQFFN
jgi:hypothetical protein